MDADAPDRLPVLLTAALLHDAGLLAARAAADGASPADPARHATLSADLIARVVPPPWAAPAADLARAHHEPRAYDEKLLAVADRLAAGDLVVGDAADHAGQLRSLLSRVRGSGTTSEPPGALLGLRPLAFDAAALFPDPVPLPAAERRVAYRALAERLERDLRRIPAGPPDAYDAYIETLTSVLQQVAWAVPAAAPHDPADISLYDHARTTAALTAALARSGLDEPALDALLAGDQAVAARPCLTLIGGDVTGVQTFLYSLTARGAARTLRGRSFYLQLITEVVARFLARRLALPPLAVLYAGGGRFYLLAPGGTDAAALRAVVDRALLRCHGSDLYLALGAVPLCPADLVDGARFRAVWRRLGEEINRWKERRFAALPAAERHAAVFAPSGQGGASAPCAVCRGEGPFGLDQPADDPARVCLLCRSLEQLGTDLRDARAVVLEPVEPMLPAGPAASYADTMRAFGYRVTVLDAAGMRRSTAMGGAMDGTLLVLDTPDVLSGPLPDAATTGGLGIVFYPVTVVTPRTADGAIAEFADLARAARGIERLGVLRMDIDDLGAVFASGLGEDATLARVANLSALLRLFFEGWVGTLAARHNALSATGHGDDRIYVIYSGGDDLMVVGSWSELPALAGEIARDFGRYCGANPAMHLSGGIAVLDARFPLYQAAEAAGEALEQAKAREEGGRVVKDALDFLGRTVSWSDAGLAGRRAEELAELVAAGGAPRALLRTLMNVAVQEEAARRATSTARGARPDQLAYGPWIWRGTYALARLAERSRPPHDAQVRELASGLVRPDVMRTLGLAGRWAELLAREGEGAA